MLLPRDRKPGLGGRTELIGTGFGTQGLQTGQKIKGLPEFRGLFFFAFQMFARNKRINRNAERAVHKHGFGNPAFALAPQKLQAAKLVFHAPPLIALRHDVRFHEKPFVVFGRNRGRAAVGTGINERDGLNFFARLFAYRGFDIGSGDVHEILYLRFSAPPCARGQRAWRNLRVMFFICHLLSA